MIIQATKVWWDGEKLMTETIDPTSVYSDIVSDGGLDPRNKFDTPLQRQWVGLDGFEQKELMAMSAREAVFATEAKLKEKNT
jgi:hypothetical protein